MQEAEQIDELRAVVGDLTKALEKHLDEVDAETTTKNLASQAKITFDRFERRLARES